MLEKVMTAIEKRIFGSGAFPTHAAATGALLKFCTEHRYELPDLQNVKDCLSCLEAGERTNAILAYQKIHWGKEGFSDWWPPAVQPLETEEYVTELFSALAERWHRLRENFVRGPA